MSNAKGTRFETQLVGHLRSVGGDAERMAKTGSEDEGDIVLRIGGRIFIIEAKNVARLALADWVGQARTEAANYAKHRRNIDVTHYLVIHKHRNHGVSESYVTMPLEEWLEQVTP